MPSYRAPVDDYLFLLHDVARVQDRRDLPGFADLEPEFTAEILRGLAAFHEDVLHPANMAADAEGARLVDGAVRTPSVYRDLAKPIASRAGCRRGFPRGSAAQACRR